MEGRKTKETYKERKVGGREGGLREKINNK
jgi:hypothetical protein